MSKKSLQGQVALVTGSSSGIGAAVAIALAEAGADVVVNYARSSKGAEEVVNEIISNGGNHLCHLRHRSYLGQQCRTSAGLPFYRNEPRPME